MDQAAKDKAAITRKMNQAAGGKPPLPGQNRDREQVLRAEYSAHLKPADFAEIIWVIDMARCQAAIEFLDAQIVGVRLRHIKEAYKKLRGSDFGNSMRRVGEEQDEAALLEGVRLDIYAEQNFAPRGDQRLLGDATFASLLGTTNRGEIEEVRLLQQGRHAEAKERDRLFNQLKRRRSQDLRDAILVEDDKRQAALFALIMAEAGAVPQDSETAEDAELPAQEAA